MLKISPRIRLAINAKTALINIVLTVNSLVWYLYFLNFLKSSFQIFPSRDIIVIVGINLLGIVTSALFSSILTQKNVKRLRFLSYWLFAGLALSPLPLLMNNASFLSLVIIAAIVGLYFGSGLPVLMGYYAASTEAENRARLSGVVILLSGICVPLLSIIGNTNAALTSITLLAWRFSGLILLFLLKPPEIKIDKSKNTTYRAIITNSSLLLYFIPWLMFSLVNNLAFPILNNFFTGSFVNVSAMLESFLAGFSALFFGFFADLVGRKRLMLFGFVLIGLGYASLGLFPGSTPMWWFYTCADGISWGAFTTIFLLTLWGDLANRRNAEKYYVIGFLPYLLSSFLQVSIGQLIAGTVTNEIAIFSYASFFLFASVLPLAYAPETLPEKAIKDRDLKSYLEKAQKIAEKNEKARKR